MTRNIVGLASVLVVASILAAALIAGSMLPETMELPVHWGLSGEADGFAGKWTALLMPAGMTAGVSLLFYFLPAIEPRRDGLERSQGLYLWGWIAILLMGAVIELVVLSHAFSWGLPAIHMIIGAVGIMFALIGNQLGKSRSMYMMGVRTPWTLASEAVWIRTHRLCGKLMVGGGLAIVLAAALGLAPEMLMAATLAVVAVGVGWPVAYSFILWRREQADQARG